MALSRDQCIELVEEHYFGNVSRGDVDAALACFTPDAVVTIRHGDAPPRLFSASGDGADPLGAFLEHLLANYEPRFTDFVHYIDAENERCASRFVVKLTARPEGAAATVGDQELLNCNFFELEGERISAMLIYYANPGSRGGAAPTGYPAA
jgi:ketosteroid isomerase-like protein